MAKVLEAYPQQPSEVGFARRLNELHEMLYRRGGIRPVNAAIEELAKLLLLRMWLSEEPYATIDGFGPLRGVLDPVTLRSRGDVEGVKAAFRLAIRSPRFAARLPDGTTQPVWAVDEPLRITRADIVAESLKILEPLFEGESPAHLDPLGQAFDVFLRGRYDHAGGLSTYLTPHAVTTALAHMTLALIDPVVQTSAAPRITFGDPCCGTGRFLVAVLEELRKRVLEASGGDPGHPSVATFRQFRDTSIFGADQSLAAVAKARTNLLLYGARHPQVWNVVDSVTDSTLDGLRGTLSLILTNPPFGDGKYDSAEGIARTSRAFPSLAKRERIDPALAFVARCLELLCDGGVLGIILPDGLVDGAVLRRTLLHSDTADTRHVSIEGIISLPTATFALSGTVARTSAVILRRGRAKSNHVYIARSEHVGYLKQGGGVAIDPSGNDLGLIAEIGVSTFSTSEEQAGKETAILSRAPLAAYVDRMDLRTLDPSRLDPLALSARHSLREQGATELRELIKPVKPRRSRPLGPHTFVSVLHVDDLGTVAWHEAEQYRPSTPGQLAYGGELIVSLLNPSKFRAAVIPETYKYVECSAEFGVFEASCDPYAVLALLHDARVQAQLAPLGRGTSSSRRRIDQTDVLDLLVRGLTDDDLARLGGTLRSQISQVNRARRAIADIYEEEGRAI